MVISRLDVIMAEDDVDLLLGLQDTNCTTEQNSAVVQVLTGRTPWQALGVQVLSTKSECMAAFKSLSLLVHPDLCRHHRNKEAFQKLNEACDWARDREGWEKEKQDRLSAAYDAQQWVGWVIRGGPLKDLRVQEQMMRHVGFLQEERERMIFEEEVLWRCICQAEREAKASQEGGFRHSTRNRSQPQRYQSEQEQGREHELRQQARDKKQQSQEVDPAMEEDEEQGHDWKTGEWMGEAKNPGPPKGSTAKGGIPWGMQRREPGQAPQAQQANGRGRPHQKRHQPATNTNTEDAEGWTTVRRTATTSTPPPTTCLRSDRNMRATCARHRGRP